MKRCFIIVGLLVLGLVASACLCTTMAQEAEIEDEYAYGNVKSISTDKIVVSEFDYDNDLETDIEYVIDANTKYENVNSQKDISSGDYVEITYATKMGKKIAILIIVEKPSEDEE